MDMNVDQGRLLTGMIEPQVPSGSTEFPSISFA
jgi:hypothetical protein